MSDLELYAPDDSPTVLALKHNCGICLVWTDEEDIALLEGLIMWVIILFNLFNNLINSFSKLKFQFFAFRFASYSWPMQCVKIAEFIGTNKLARDVALRIKSMNVSYMFFALLKYYLYLLIYALLINVLTYYFYYLCSCQKKKTD